MNLLFPTDFSDASIKAFGTSVALAEKLAASIHILHVQSPPIVSTGFDDGGLQLVSDNLLMEMDDVYLLKLEAFKEEVTILYNLTSKKIPVEITLRTGKVSDEIVHMAQKIDAAYIITTIRHQTNVERLLFGSSVHGILNKSEIPVITLPEDQPLREFHRIAFASDLTFNDESIIRRLLEFATLYKAKLYCFHVHDSNLETENAIIKDFRALYKDAIEQELISFHLTENLDIIDGMDYFVEENDIELLVMLKQKNYWLDFLQGSLSKKMAFHSKIPLLIYHE